jgi:ribosomal protein RSM22 (predicted rRNA methylase)
LRLQEGHSFDFIVLGNVLNELFPDAPRRIAKRGQLLTRVIESWLAPKGFVILLEPALKKTSRDLLLLRDRLIDGLGLNVYSPCVHSCHCPAVAPGQPSDWCHESLNWQAPWLIREIDRRIGNRKTALKYSYVVLSRTKHSVRDAAQLCLPTSLKPDGQQTWRVVSEVMEERGKASVFLCGPRGRVKVAHLQKHVSETNEEFLYLNRGQVVMAGPLEIRSASDWRVKPASAVRILMGRRQ